MALGTVEEISTNRPIALHFRKAAPPKSKNPDIAGRRQRARDDEKKEGKGADVRHGIRRRRM